MPCKHAALASIYAQQMAAAKLILNDDKFKDWAFYIQAYCVEE